MISKHWNISPFRTFSLNFETLGFLASLSFNSFVRFRIDFKLFPRESCFIAISMKFRPLSLQIYTRLDIGFKVCQYPKFQNSQIHGANTNDVFVKGSSRTFECIFTSENLSKCRNAFGQSACMSVKNDWHAAKVCRALLTSLGAKHDGGMTSRRTSSWKTRKPKGSNEGGVPFVTTGLPLHLRPSSLSLSL